jgi:hypothetical protein
MMHNRINGLTERPLKSRYDFAGLLRDYNAAKHEIACLNIAVDDANKRATKAMEAADFWQKSSANWKDSSGWWERRAWISLAVDLALTAVVIGMAAWGK